MNIEINKKTMDLIYTIEEGINYLNFQIKELRFEAFIKMLMDINDALDTIYNSGEFIFVQKEILILKKSILKEMILINEKEFFEVIALIDSEIKPRFYELKLKMESHMSKIFS